MEYITNKHIYKDFVNQKIQCDTRSDIRKKNIDLGQIYQDICQFTNKSTQLSALSKLYDLSHHEEWREKIISYYFTHKITACLHSTDKKLQHMAARVFANLTLGNKMTVEKVKQSNGEHYLEYSLSCLLLSCNLECLLQPVLATLTNIAADLELDCATEILENLNKILSSHMYSITILKTISQLICNMSSRQKINKENVQLMTLILNYLVKYKDEIILTRVTTTALLLSKMGGGLLSILIDSHVLSWLVEFLNHNRFGQQHIALITIGYFAANEEHTQAVLDENLLPYLRELLLHENNDICEDATYVILEIVAKSQAYKQAVIDAGLLPLVVENLNKGKNKLRAISMRVVQNMFENSTQSQKDFIMGCEPILGVCQLLKISYFEYMFEFSLENVLQCILTILRESGNRRRIALKIEECGGLLSIQELAEKPNVSKSLYMLLNKILQEYFSDV